jgi:hypothetical protein
MFPQDLRRGSSGVSYLHRYLLFSAHNIFSVDAANALNETSRPLAKGTPGLGADLPAKVAYITTKAEKILGISHNAPLERPSNGEGLFRYHSLEETTKDTLKDYEQRGWW